MYRNIDKNIIFGLSIIFIVLSISTVSAFNISDFFEDFWGRMTGKYAHNICGDGFLEGDELCDSEVYNCKIGDNYKGKNSCLSDCSAFTGCVTSEKCGDGIVNGNERCDDKNIGSGDGCSASCKRETGWVCSGEPSVCSREDPYQYCGDGFITGSEECDDNCDRYGGVCSNGDGCSADCKVESGWDCSGEPSFCYRNGKIEKCSPTCNIFPSECPSSGIQTKTCISSDCEETEEVITCTPPNLKPQNNNYLCQDSDSESNNQFHEQGFAITWYNNCNSYKEFGKKDCDFLISASDFCINSNTLIEQTCNNNLLEKIEVNCPNGCQKGRCL
jgi:cysteine-rich repeat protein